MDKLKLHSKDLTAENIEKLAALFPNCLTETKAEDGSIKHAIDFDLLRQELSADLVEGPQERYRLDWPGKREALATANAPIAKTLRPCREESVDFDSTKNLYVEGDNLDALKLLQETYLGKVKMMCIDPPYNTGKDFVYEDDFKQNSDEYLERSNQSDARGNRLVANTEANGRFHSDWLSMMSSRLKLARNLLKDDGVIFVSIDDNEVHSLRTIMAEIFGPSNFVATFVWQKRVSPDNDEKHVTATHDYVVCFMKSKESGGIKGFERTSEQDDRYTNLDSDPRGPWTSSDLTRREFREHDFYEIELPSGRKVTPAAGRSWSVPPIKFQALLKDNRVWFGPNGDAMPRLKRFLTDVSSRVVPVTWLTRDLSGENQRGKREVNSLFHEESHVFDNPKPTDLIATLIKMTASPGDLIMDFFSGTATTAHAVFKTVASSGYSCPFIMIQLPEKPSKGSFDTIAEIGKERIRRAGAKIKDEIRRMKDEMGEENLFGEESSPSKSKTSSFNIHPSYLKNPEGLDTGFRVLKVDSSNMADVYYRPDEVTQDGLALQVENIKPDRSPEDLLFQVLLDWGVDLALPIEQETIAGKTVFFVDNNALAACFDTGLDEDFVKTLAKRAPLRAVFRDASFATDATKINIEQIFKALSPHTELKAI